MKDCCRYIKKFKVSGLLNDYTTQEAAKYGHLDCLKYAHQNGCPWDDQTTTNAAKHGHLECLKYAHENGCPWYIGTTRYAAIHGHLDCLKYAHENGCPWVERDTLYGLSRHASKINLDDNWWRTFLFDKDITSCSTLKRLIDNKKEEIIQLQLNSKLLFPYTSKDVIKYVLWSYF